MFQNPFWYGLQYPSHPNPYHKHLCIWYHGGIPTCVTAELCMALSSSCRPVVLKLQTCLYCKRAIHHDMAITYLKQESPSRCLSCRRLACLLDQRFDGAVAAGESISVTGVGSFPCAIASSVVRGRKGCGLGRAKVTIAHALQMHCQAKITQSTILACIHYLSKFPVIFLLK